MPRPNRSWKTAIRAPASAPSPPRPALSDRPLRRGAASRAEPAHQSARGPRGGSGVDVGLTSTPRGHPARRLRPPGAGASNRAVACVPPGAVHAVPRGDPGAARPARGRWPRQAHGSPRGSGSAGAEYGARIRPLLRRDPRRRILPSRAVGVQPAGGDPGRTRMTVEILDRELERLEGLWADGLSDTYHAYLDTVVGHKPEAQPKLALAAALIEVGIRLQGLGGRAAPPPTLLMGDLCLARASRLLADTATQAVQVAFAQAIEGLSAAAAAGNPGRPVRELLVHAFSATA